MTNAQPALADISLASELINIIPAAVFFKSADGRYLGCNSAFEAATGIRKADMLGKTAEEIWPKDLAAAYRAEDEALLRSHGIQTYETQAAYADGSRHEAVVYRTTFSNPDGSPGGIIGVAWDVTDRNQAARALRDQLCFIEQLADTIPSPAFFKDPEGRYLGCNRAFELFCGLKREDIVGKTLFDIWPPDRAQIYNAADEALLKAPGSQSYEAPIRYADGTDHDVIFHRATFKKADGSLGGIVGVFWDITERKRAERALRRSEERFRRIVENAPFGVLVTDANDTMVFANRRFAELFHYHPEQIATLEDWQALAFPDPHYRLEVTTQTASDIEALRSGALQTPPAREVRVVCGDGIVRDIEVVATVEDDLIYSVYNDVTERNRAEQALRDVLQAEALHDPLTALFNRRYLGQALEREFSRAARSGETVSVIMGDIDHFKKINDTFGHDCGDRVLQSIARQLNTHSRRGDIACRYGGEEFTLLLPNAALDIACERADRLREAIRDLSLSSNGQTIGRVTMSFGVATFPQHGDTPEKVLKAADDALMRAKTTGRDRVVSAGLFLPAT